MGFVKWIKSIFKKKEPIIEPLPKITKFEWKEQWTEHLKKITSNKMSELEQAKDIDKLYPGFKNLSEMNKTIVWSVFFKYLAYYESGFNPSCESVDVGVKNDRETWSVGLLQLSGVDKKNLELTLGFDYQVLKDPIKNLTQGLEIMVNQIKKRGKIFIPNDEKGDPSKYWATIAPGNKYDKTDLILAQVHKLRFEEKVEDEIPWLKIALSQIGVSETNNPAKVIEYHQATSLAAKSVKTAWCSSFVNWVLMKAGYKRTNSAWARDWLHYGTSCKPTKGCIMVFERNDPGGDSHVTFWIGEETKDEYLCCGGNQAINKVSIKGYDKKDLLDCRWPIK